jgi:hypothetical protein
MWQEGILMAVFGPVMVAVGAYLIFMYREFLAGRYHYLPGTVIFNGLFGGPAMILAGLATVVIGAIVFPPGLIIPLVAGVVSLVKWRKGKLFPKPAS